MANYAVRIYLNTGFNAVNIPDGPALLESCAHFDTTAIGVMQGRLSSIRVRATWSQVENADYVRLSDGVKNYYFSIPSGGVSMLANDSAEISLLYDYVLSAGGVSNLQVLDGYTKRVHVTDDTFGKYTESDPLTAPAHPLELEMKWFHETGQLRTYVEATLNLPKTAVSDEGVVYRAVHEFWDGGDEYDSVVVPTVQELDSATQYELDGITESVNPGTRLYDLSNTAAIGDLNNRESILRGMARVRSLGIEQGAIINQVSIPEAYAEPGVTTGSATEPGQDGKTLTDLKIETFRGKKGEVSSALPYEYTGARNKRLDYGEYTQYGLLSCSGESCEFKAEDIKDPSNPTSPKLKFMADPHTDGRPYFRFRYVDGDASDRGFFRNCITGLQWQQVPLYYEGVSGSRLNTIRYNNSREMAVENYGMMRSNISSELVKESIHGFAGMVGGALGSDASTKTERKQAKEQAQGGLASIVSGIVDYVQGLNDLNQQYNMQKRYELQEYMMTNNVSAPETHFPYNADLMRDFYGNGCLIYRYKYSSADINRIDKLLTMYGYRYTKPLETSDFTNKQYFNYVECANVSIGGGLPKWLADGASMMLRNGVRVWHVLPSPTYYNQNNPNR